MNFSYKKLTRLLLRYRDANDAEAFADMASDLWGELFRLAMRILHDRHLAEDVTQETLLHLSRVMLTASCKSGRKVVACAYRTVRHRAFDEYRKRYRKCRRVEYHTALPETITRDGLTPLDTIVYEEDQDRLHVWLESDKSTEDEKIVIKGRYIENPSKSFAELARKLGVCERTVRRYRDDALVKLEMFLTV